MSPTGANHLSRAPGAVTTLALDMTVLIKPAREAQALVVVGPLVQIAMPAAIARGQQSRSLRGSEAGQRQGHQGFLLHLLDVLRRVLHLGVRHFRHCRPSFPMWGIYVPSFRRAPLLVRLIITVRRMRANSLLVPFRMGLPSPCSRPVTGTG